MEDYNGAHEARLKDLVALETAGRDIASLHIGGIVVECQLKALLVAYHQISAWDERSRRRKDSMTGLPVPNPRHGLLTALRRMDLLYKRAKLDPLFLTHLNQIMHPMGTLHEDFIDIRYYPDSEVSVMRRWRQSFNYVCGWLRKNAKAIQ